MSTEIEVMNGRQSVDYPTYYEVSYNNTEHQTTISIKPLGTFIMITILLLKAEYIWQCYLYLLGKSSVSMYLVFDREYINVYIF